MERAQGRGDDGAVVPSSASSEAVMRAYRATRDARRRSVTSVYRIHGFLSSGTYGRVYKAEERLSLIHI